MIECLQQQCIMAGQPVHTGRQALNTDNASKWQYAPVIALPTAFLSQPCSECEGLASADRSVMEQPLLHPSCWCLYSTFSL